MEEVVCEVEKDLGVKVERMDVGRDKAAAALLSLVSLRGLPPVLYNRESLQQVTMKIDPENEGSVPPVDRKRVRAWAKGRRLSVEKKEEPDPKLEEMGIGEAELAAMSEEQRRGLENIRERTKEKASRSSK
eukprot:CAMPEP_0202444148 /NCGR_PEP_ID=MMETSP1360-20130828/3290_1 /ASSEMBLY_ACC=CAM_ASM_000848 /TAXON_ID=515479 /ORGANISM="Licmophora paradoxa, Strain CCMP2313" /LENGTH=130 /DNA_ID=CAMNT_0049060065 /DNA_START=144 /DNA_END=536 /DNA_ORIENTATION=-